jgi:hypothetical protein
VSFLPALSARPEIPNELEHGYGVVETPTGVACIAELVEHEIEIGAGLGDPGETEIE